MIVAYFDGACAPSNPGGNIGYGGIVYEDGEEIHRFSGFKEAQRSNTNNIAEYMACSEILSWLIHNRLTDESITVKGDSQLVVNQLNGLWRIKSGAYVDYAIEAKKLLEFFVDINFEWIPRALNETADALSNEEFKKRGIEEFKKPVKR